VEGLLREIVGDLSGDQPLRRIQDEDLWRKIEDLLDRLRAVVGNELTENEGSQPLVENSDEEKPFLPFTITLDDPSGDSFLEFIGSISDPHWQMRRYERTKQDDINLGMTVDGGEGRNWREDDEVYQDGEGLDEEVHIFPGVCSSCGAPLDTKMKKISVPYFKVGIFGYLCMLLRHQLPRNLQDVMIMSTNCDRCGYRDNEIKSGSAVSEQGQRITLTVQNREDLSRDLLKVKVIPPLNSSELMSTIAERYCENVNTRN
jgi:zinc finger protein